MRCGDFDGGITKRCCQSCGITYLKSMPLNKASISRLLSEKCASIFCVTEETSMEQTVPEINLQRIGSIVVKKGSSVCGIFIERDALTHVVSAGPDPKATQVRELMSESFYLNLPYYISV